MAITTTALAQGTITFQYFYDDLGQLIKVVDSAGNVVEYVYDQVGNILEIKRSTIPGGPGALAIFNFTPQSGGQGTTVTIQGQRFSATPSANTVRFNGMSATVLSATTISLVVQVPSGATTGPITVTVGSATATSSTPFTVLPLPIITSVQPKYSLPGAVIQNFVVGGVNLAGSTFSFIPVLSPPAMTVGNVSINPSGASATMSLTVGANAVGTFVLIATNTVGSSDPFQSPGNTFRVLFPAADEDRDGLTNGDEVARGTDPFNPDTDGDGFPDGVEVEVRSNPLDPNSTPLTVTPPIAEAAGIAFSVLNTADLSKEVNEAVGPVFSVLNTAATSDTLNEAVGLTFSILNTVDPGMPPSSEAVREAAGLTFSISNAATISPSPGSPSRPPGDEQKDAGRKGPVRGSDKASSVVKKAKLRVISGNIRLRPRNHYQRR